MYYENQHVIECRSKNDRHGKSQGIEFPNVDRYRESIRGGNKRGFDHLRTERGSSGGLLSYIHYHWYFNRKHREGRLDSKMCLFFMYNLRCGAMPIKHSQCEQVISLTYCLII